MRKRKAKQINSEFGIIRQNPENPRRISTQALIRLEESIKRDPKFMELRPIIIDETGMILAGNMRMEACLRAGMKTLPDRWVRKATDLNKEEQKRFILVDNAPDGMAGTWDVDGLLEKFGDINLNELGFDFELPVSKGKDAAPKIDERDELQEQWGTAEGQIWSLGQHRLICGDSTERETVERLLDGEIPQMMVTDPPYGVDYDPEWRKRSGLSETGAFGLVHNDTRADWREAWALFEGDIAYVWHASGELQGTVLRSLQATGFEIRATIIWAKDSLVIGRGHYHQQHEPCFYAIRRGGRSRFIEDRTQTTIWKDIDTIIRPDELVFFARDKARKVYGIRGDTSTLWQIPRNRKNESGHSTQKPLECMARPIRNHIVSTVYDPFVGSGTTIMAAEQLDRTCYAVEYSPEYVAVCLQRFLDATGTKPELLE